MKTSKLSPGGYDPSFFARLAAVEDEHFWFRARNELILRTVARLAASLPCHARIAEIGCGTGNVLRWLRQACPGVSGGRSRHVA
jgi:methylase of polypeptide subunit release factors